MKTFLDRTRSHEINFIASPINSALYDSPGLYFTLYFTQLSVLRWCTSFISYVVHLCRVC